MIWELSQDAAYEYSLLALIKDEMTTRFVHGDVNMDGEFTIADAVLLQKWLLAVPGTELPDKQAGDLCEDGRLNVLDMCVIKQELLNK